MNFGIRNWEIGFCKSKMCIPVENRLEVLEEHTFEAFIDQLDRNELPTRSYLQNQKQVKILFPMCLIFIYTVIFNILVLPNVDKRDIFCMKNMFLVVMLLGLYVVFRKLNKLLLNALDWTPSKIAYLISCRPWISQFLMWFKGVYRVIYYVAIGITFVCFIANIVSGVVLVVHYAQK